MSTPEPAQLAHQYQPPKLEAESSIRLLEILSDLADDGNIKCILHHFNAHEIPSYDTVSYCWGDADAESDRIIYIVDPATGNQHKQSLHENLWGFLRQMHESERAGRFLWVDFLCIDQNDKEEKNHQVPRMGEIFSRAGRNWSWLGQQPELLGTWESLQRYVDEKREAITAFFSSSALSWPPFMGYNNLGQGNWRVPPPPSRPKAADEAFCESEQLQHDWDNLKHFRIHIAMITIMALPYWKRVWVVQEVALAKEVILMFGAQTMKFDDFFLAYKVHFFYSLRKDPRRNLLASAVEARHAGDGLYIENVLEWGRLCNSKWQVDRIYGLMGLLKHRGGDTTFLRSLRIDYDKTTAEVYWDIVFRCPVDLEGLLLVSNILRESLSCPDQLGTLRDYASNARTPPLYKTLALLALRVFAILKPAGGLMWALSQPSEKASQLQVPKMKWWRDPPPDHEPKAFWTSLASLVLETDNNGTGLTDDQKVQAAYVGALVARLDWEELSDCGLAEAGGSRWRCGAHRDKTACTGKHGSRAFFEIRSPSFAFDFLPPPTCSAHQGQEDHASQSCPKENGLYLDIQEIGYTFEFHQSASVSGMAGDLVIYQIT